jgi:hypothetical protein
MATNTSLDSLYEEWKSHPKDVIVRKFLEYGTVATLTEFKVKLTSRCQQIPNFPKGEVYARRKPIGLSLFTSLEVRLADDIFHLLVCIDTNVVQPEVRAMFKQSEDDSETVHSITVCEDQDTNGVNFSSPILNATQSQGELFSVETRLNHKHCTDRMAGLEDDLFIFKEKVDKEIRDILAKWSQRDKLIKKQEEEIRNLKTENLKIKSRLQTLACITNDSSPTRNVISNENANNQQSYATAVLLINSMTMPTDCAVNANCSSVKNPNTFLRDKNASSNHAKQNKPEVNRSNQIYLCENHSENQGDNDIQSDQSKLHNSNNTIPDVVEVDNTNSTNDNLRTQSEKKQF